MDDQITTADYLGLTAAYFEWAESYDSKVSNDSFWQLPDACWAWDGCFGTNIDKDWTRLSKIIAPTLTVDYSSFLNKSWPAMPASEYIAMISSPSVLGDPTLKTQHFCGGSKWEMVSPTEVIGWHQLRVPHQKYTDETLTTVAVKGHAHSTNKHWYKKIDGVWKFAGLAPEIRFFEYDFDKVFASGREHFGATQELKEKEEGPEGEAEKAAINVEASMGIPAAA